MGGVKQGNPVVFFIVSVLGALFLLAEAVLQAGGRSLCAAAGCRLVNSLARFGDLSIILAGMAALSLLGLLSALNLRRRKELLDFAINLLLIAALAAEGFFVGYQTFWLAERCLICLGVFGIFFVLGLLRLLGGWKELWAGFAACAAVLFFVGFILPPPGRALPFDKKMVLFTSAECRHCAEIGEEIAGSNFDITPIPVKEYATTLKSLGIDQVPTLLVNGRYEKLILTGKEAIRRYLTACQSSGKSSPPGADVPVSKKGANPKSSGWGREMPLPSLNTPDALFNPAPDEGVCKEEQKCD